MYNALNHFITERHTYINSRSYERQSTVDSIHLSSLITLNIKTAVWDQNDDQLNLILLRTWATDFLAEISTQLLNGGRIKFIVRVKHKFGCKTTNYKQWTHPLEEYALHLTTLY